VLTDVELSGARSRLVRQTIAAVTGMILANAAVLPDASAQTPGVPETGAARSPMCVRLEGQLAAIDRGQGDHRADQIRRYEEAASKQQAELDRVIAQARSLGCGASSFFLFGGGQPAQCDQLNGQIQRMRANLDKILSGLQQLQGSGSDREEQRQAIMVALGQNNCGPQYRAAAAARPRNFFETLLGTPPESTVDMPAETPQSSSFRTVCVRTCDGSFFPISYSASPAKFPSDERVCQRMCPAAEVALYAYRNQGEDISKAMSINGRAYTELPNAFRYRQEYNPSCTCKKPGESWTAAVGEDSTVERGDIVVTDDNAKALSQPKPEPQAKPARTEPAKSRARTGAANPSGKPVSPGADPAPGPGSGATAPPGTLASPSDKPRPVGPQFFPVR